MRLFKYEGYNIEISEEAYCIKAFRDIWDRDTSKSKTQAKLELGYVYFMEDPRSDYLFIVDEKERSKQIIEQEGLGKWKSDKLIDEARKIYASFKSSSALLAEDLRIAIDKLRESLKTIDLSTLDDKGKPIYTLDSYARAIKQSTDLVVSLDAAEKAIAKEITQSDKVRGTNEKSMYEDF